MSEQKQQIIYTLTPDHAQLLAGLVAANISELELALLQVDPIGKLESRAAARMTNKITEYTQLLNELKKQTREQQKND